MQVTIPLEVYFIGEDDWSRKLYRDNNGITYALVDGSLHTLTNWGEPIAPIDRPYIVTK